MSEDEISAALDNLAQIKSGNDPRSSGRDPLHIAETDVDDCFETHELDEYLPRERVHVGIARWDRKNGLCQYDTRLTKRRFNKRVTGAEPAIGSHSIVINSRIIEEDSKEGFIDTVRHELAHVIAYVDATCKPHGISPGHGPGWKRWARTLGADPRSRHLKKDMEYNYWFGCPACNWWQGKIRKSKKVKKPFFYRCSQCGESCSSFRDGDEPPDEHGIGLEEGSA